MKDLFLSILKEEVEYDPETGVKIVKEPGGLKKITIPGRSNKSVIIPERDIGKGQKGSGLSNELIGKIIKRSEFDRDEANEIVDTLYRRKREKEKIKDPFQKAYGDEK